MPAVSVMVLVWLDSASGVTTLWRYINHFIIIIIIIIIIAEPSTRQVHDSVFTRWAVDYRASH